MLKNIGSVFIFSAWLTVSFQTKLLRFIVIYGLLTKREVKMGGYWRSSFFCVFMDRDEVEVHKHAKNEVNIQPP